MNILKKYRSYLLEDAPSILIEEDFIHIKNYIEIKEVKEDSAIIETKNKKIKIKGNNLKIQKLEDSELLLLGNILKVEMEDKNE